MTRTDIRPDVIQLLAALQPTSPDPTQWLHTDGRPLTPTETDLIRTVTFNELKVLRDQQQHALERDREQSNAMARIQEITRPYFSRLPKGSVLGEVLKLMTDAERAEFEELQAVVASGGVLKRTAQILTITQTEPTAWGEAVPCGLCDEPTEAGDFTVTTLTPDGVYAVCEDCADAHAPGLADAAEALSDVYSALVREVEQPHRPTVAAHLRQLATLADQLHSGELVVHTKGQDGQTTPVRLGGDDPFATLRRHTMRAVPSA